MPYDSTEPIFDIDLLPCAFDLSVSLNNYYALNNVNISEIMQAYSNSKIESNLVSLQPQPNRLANIPSNLPLYQNSSLQFFPRVFGMNNSSKLSYKGKEITPKPSYNHIKTILGHMTMQDDMLGPTPIYCVCNIPKLEIAVTGDSNG